MEKTDEEWREQLSRDEYAVLRKAGTERAFTGEYTDTKTVGVYRCRACQAELFQSETKFDSHCGWPSFYAPLAEDRVEYIEDTSMGMKRVEVRCANCGSHLGHVFDDGYGTPTGQRYCINSISVTLEPAAVALSGRPTPVAASAVGVAARRRTASGTGRVATRSGSAPEWKSIHCSSCVEPRRARPDALGAGDVGVQVVADHPRAARGCSRRGPRRSGRSAGPACPTPHRRGRCTPRRRSPSSPVARIFVDWRADRPVGDHREVPSRRGVRRRRAGAAPRGSARQLPPTRSSWSVARLVERPGVPGRARPPPSMNVPARPVARRGRSTTSRSTSSAGIACSARNALAQAPEQRRTLDQGVVEVHHARTGHAALRAGR